MRVVCDQYSAEWWLHRKGRFTASDARTIMIAGAGLETLCWAKAAEKIMTNEQYLGVLARSKTTPVLDFGSAQENFSRDWLSAKLGVFIEQGGIEIFDDNTAFSSDGFFPTPRGLEIKNHEPKMALWMFYKIQDGLRKKLPWSKIIDKSHYAQIQFAMWKKPEMLDWIFALGSDCWGDALHFWAVPPDKECHQKIAAGVETGNKRVTEIVLDLLQLQNEYERNQNESRQI